VEVTFRYAVCQCVVCDKPFGPFIFEGCLTGEVYLLVLQQFVEDVTASKRDRGYFEHGGASLHFSLEVRNLSNDRFGCRMCQPQPSARQVFRLRVHWVVVCGDGRKE
jgi:hypothetical protein